MVLLEPRGRGKMLTPLLKESLDPLPIGWSAEERLELRLGNRLQHDPGVVRRGPELRIEQRPELIGSVVPRSMQIQGELRERLHARQRHCCSGPLRLGLSSRRRFG